MNIHGWNDAVNPSRVDLVFENRNKAYGAYVIRKKYERLVVMAFLIHHHLRYRLSGRGA
jgi:hypothetical protein